MRHLAIVLVLAGSSPRLAAGQTPVVGSASQPSIPPIGSTVRLTVASSGARYSGTLLAWEQDSIWLRRADSSTASLVAARVTGVEVSAGMGSRAGRGALIGGGVGLLLGIGGAIAVANSDCFLCGDLPPGTIALGLAVTAGVGALLGAGIGSQFQHERWERYNTPSLVLAPTRGGVRAGVTLPFP